MLCHSYLTVLCLPLAVLAQAFHHLTTSTYPTTSSRTTTFQRNASCHLLGAVLSVCPRRPPVESKLEPETCLLFAMDSSTADHAMQVRGHLETMDSQTWICALSFLKTTQPRACTLGCLRCSSRTLRATLQDISSCKILNLSEICNYPDYPHVRKLLRGLVHPLAGLEPTYAPGRPNRQLLSKWTRVSTKHSSPPLYNDLDIVPVPYSARHIPCRADSAPPSYRARDDLDFYQGVEMSWQHWHGSIGMYLEYRSQDWVSQDDDRYNGPEPWNFPWRTLRAIADRRYSGAGMVGQP